MRKNKNKESKNYLDFIPIKNPDMKWDVDENQVVTFHVPLKGFFAKVAQVAFNRPKETHISLEEYGNFIWPLIDGKNTVFEIGLKVRDHFGDDAEPLYERLVNYMRILQGNRFILMEENF
ncbi:MAG: PqqD family protein [Lachnospiraceae bacterium]|nr:PqqD family protein [Lachnospiraceae bacterium]MDD3615271.1 PqqD family protein [Lachnospiraceae bacterium]